MESIKDKNVLIVGATGGIGRNTAKLLKQSGANLFLTARDADKLASLALELGIDKENCFVLELKNAKNEIQQMADVIHSKCLSIDILINASGIGIIKSLEDLTEEEIIQSLQINLIAVFNLLKSFVPKMKEQKKGLIINLPGVLGKTPMAGSMAYSASKYGLNGMLKSLREELKRTDIRITNIFLGGTDTPFWDKNRPKSTKKINL